MCATCGCGDDAGTRVSDLDGTVHDILPAAAAPHEHPHPHPHEHPHDHGHPHDHEHDHGHPRPQSPGTADAGHSPAAEGRTLISLEENLLAKNDLLAARNRGWLEGRGIQAFNVMSSPGRARPRSWSGPSGNLPVSWSLV